MIAKTVFITGATSGIGFELSKKLLNDGVTVVLGSKTDQVGQRVRKLLRSPRAHILKCDLSDLDSVKDAVENLAKQFEQLDILVNNAGIMSPPYSLTKQGFESQFGVNYLGHYALTVLLLQRFSQLERIITVTSLAALNGNIDSNTIREHSNYNSYKSYAQSKLANMLFSYGLNEHLKTNGYSHTISLGAHPGYSRTNLQRHVKGPLRKIHSMWTQISKAQTAKSGTLPILYAITDNNASPEDYYVPGKANELKGEAKKIKHPALNYNSSIFELLWNISKSEVQISL